MQVWCYLVADSCSLLLTAYHVLLTAVVFHNSCGAAAAVEGLLNLSPPLNYKISIEEQTLARLEARLAMNEQLHKELSHGLAVKQEVSLEVVSR